MEFKKKLYCLSRTFHSGCVSVGSLRYSNTWSVSDEAHIFKEDSRVQTRHFLVYNTLFHLKAAPLVHKHGTLEPLSCTYFKYWCSVVCNVCIGVYFLWKPGNAVSLHTKWVWMELASPEGEIRFHILLTDEGTGVKAANVYSVSTGCIKGPPTPGLHAYTWVEL